MSETVEGFMRPCERCNGSGSRENPFDGFIRTCPECNGTGIHTEAPAQPPADTPPTFKQGDKVRVDNPGSALHNEEGEYQHELYTDHSAVIFPQLSKHAKSIWTHTLRLVEADTPPAAPSEEDVEVLDWHAYSKDLMRRFLDCRNERDALRRKVVALEIANGTRHAILKAVRDYFTERGNLTEDENELMTAVEATVYGYEAAKKESQDV